MKKTILKIFFKPLTLINKIIKKNQKIIFFYSNLGFRDNVKAFYDYLIENQYNQKYKIVVSTNEYADYEKDAPENVKFVNTYQGIKVFLKAKYAFYSFGKYPIKPSKSQMVVNLWHGMPLKKVGNMEAGLEKTDYNYFTKIISMSPLFVPILMKCFNCSEDQVVVTGQPRNDEMFRKNPLTDDIIRRGADKVILWLPTYRNKEKSFPTPVLSKKQADVLNEMLKEYNIRLIIKIHPLQKLTEKLKNYSNIEFLEQDELDKSKMTIYTLLRVADALISDYSSVYFDYMLLDRPIAFTVDDIEEYGRERGFVFENPYDYMPGTKISDFEDIKNFVSDIVEGRDSFAEDRRRLNREVNMYNDGKSCIRIEEMVFGGHNQ